MMKPKKCLERLEPCPACGAKAVLISDFGTGGCQTAYVTCSKNRKHVDEPIIFDSCIGGTEHQAVVEWNEYARDLVDKQYRKGA